VDARHQKAQELADRARIEFKDGCWSVPSQSGNGWYTVIIGDDGEEGLCDCPDFGLRGEDCKHVLAAKMVEWRKQNGAPQPAETTEPSSKVKRPTYPQDWPAYNAAQTNEGRHFGPLLADLCRVVPEPERKGVGRKPVPLADQAFAAVLKVYSLFSARRFQSQLDDAAARGLVSRPMCFNSVLKALDNPALTPVLMGLIQRSALPMRNVEATFIPDSSGFCTSLFIRWFDVKYGVTKESAMWVKCHLMTGRNTNIVTAVTILEKDAGDSPQLKVLVQKTADNFRVETVPADKGYLSADNLELVDALGATMYCPFKVNSVEGNGALWDKMLGYFLTNREEFLKKYHPRSNVESTFSMIKQKFGDSVRSKTDTAMKNEVLAKIVAHNVCVCIAEWYGQGIEPAFGTEDEGRHVLAFKRPG
jgi:hypothetical protein